MDRRLAELKAGPHTQEPQFYPPGQHPAVFRTKAYMEKLQQLEANIDTPSHELMEAIQYAKDTIAQFEELQTEAKYRMLRIIEHGERPKY